MNTEPEEEGLASHEQPDGKTDQRQQSPAYRQNGGSIFLLIGVALLTSGISTGNTGLYGTGIGLMVLGAVFKWFPVRGAHEDDQG